MRQVYLSPIEKSAIYKKWHKGSVHFFVHWFAFIFVAVIITSMCVTSIEVSAMSGAI